MTATEDRHRLKRAFRYAVAFAALLWLAKLGQTLTGVALVSHGIYPLRAESLAGILFAPLIHASFTHLLSNTLPVVILGTALLYGYPRSSRIVLPAVYLLSGLGVWLFARPAYHVGASGLTFGVMFFIFTIGVLRWDRRAIALAMVVFLLYGSAFWGVLPLHPRVSFESHLAGAFTGIVLALLLRRHDAAPPERRYSWEPGEDDQS